MNLIKLSKYFFLEFHVLHIEIPTTNYMHRFYTLFCKEILIDNKLIIIVKY